MQKPHEVVTRDYQDKFSVDQEPIPMVGSAAALWILTKCGKRSKLESAWKLRILSVICSSHPEALPPMKRLRRTCCLCTVLREPSMFLPLSSISIPSPFSLHTNFSCNLFTSASFCSSFSFKADSSSCNRHRITQWQFLCTSEMFSKINCMKHSEQLFRQWKWLRALKFTLAEGTLCLWVSQQTTEFSRGQNQRTNGQKCQSHEFIWKKRFYI